MLLLQKKNNCHLTYFHMNAGFRDVSNEWKGGSAAWNNKAVRTSKKLQLMMQLASHRESPARTSPLPNQHSHSPRPISMHHHDITIWHS